MGKILIIEDEKEIREGIKALLLTRNYSVIEADNGKDALEKIDRDFPDIIICDIMMPEMTGIEFYKEFKSNQDSYLVPIIFLSAKTSHEDIRLGMNLGADDYITKPFTAKELLDAVENKLTKRKILIENIFEIIARKIPHELRTPLVSSLGFTELIMEQINEIPGEELHKFLTYIRNSNRELRRVVDEIMHEYESKFISILS